MQQLRTPRSRLTLADRATNCPASQGSLSALQRRSRREQREAARRSLKGILRDTGERTTPKKSVHFDSRVRVRSIPALTRQERQAVFFARSAVRSARRAVFKLQDAKTDNSTAQLQRIRRKLREKLDKGAGTYTQHCEDVWKMRIAVPYGASEDAMIDAADEGDVNQFLMLLSKVLDEITTDPL